MHVHVCDKQLIQIHRFRIDLRNNSWDFIIKFKRIQTHEQCFVPFFTYILERNLLKQYYAQLLLLSNALFDLKVFTVNKCFRKQYNHFKYHEYRWCVNRWNVAYFYYVVDWNEVWQWPLSVPKTYQTARHMVTMSTTALETKQWRRHQMETLSALLALCAGNLSVTSEFAVQWPVTRSFDILVFDISLVCGWINSWVNNREAGGLRCHRTH